AKDGVAIGIGAHRPDSGSCTTSPRHIFDDDLLPQRVRHVIDNDAGGNVVSPAGGATNNHRDRSRRIGLGLYEMRHEWQRSSPRYHLQELTANKCHRLLL